ncbi:MAG: histidine phosphatase family protein [Sphingobacteriaceae bacterium]|nr:MAG: histidine phosphatase family protein [Sphingobacteriaceae bacterium]
MKHLILVILTMLLVQQNLVAQKAVIIYIVRHAEKAVNDPTNNNPELSVQGNERAIDLMKFLADKKIDSIYSTNYKRTTSTVRPLAEKSGIAVKNYTPAEQSALAKNLIANAQGKKILIVGHSNTVLPIIEAFGAARPLKELTEEDYDYLFEITVMGTKTEVKIDHYGKSHHIERNIN